MIWKKIFNAPREETDDETAEVGSSEENHENEALRHETVPEDPVRQRCPAEGEGKGRERESQGIELSISIRIDDESQVGRAALLLAATTSNEAERAFKNDLSSIGWKSVATEVGGLVGDLPPKITRALVGASLNAGVVDKKRSEMHALMHAALEALEGFLATGMLEASIGAKIAIVRNSRWISVAVMGDTAYHAVAHHERCGLGVMHI